MFFDTICLKGLDLIFLKNLNADPFAPYILKEVIGLGPPDIDVAIKQSQYQGGIYQNRRPQGRQVVIRIGLNPDYSIGQTVSDLRTTLYGLLMAEGQGPAQIQLLNDITIVALTNAYISRFEINPFSKDPEVQITFECISPYLESPDRIIVDIGDLNTHKAHMPVHNPGNASAGFYIVFNTTADMPNFHLSLGSNPDYHLFINREIVDVTTVVIDTRPGLRTAQAIDTHDAITYLFDSITDGSDWIMLNPGDNIIDTSNQDFSVLDFEFTPLYWGI